MNIGQSILFGPKNLNHNRRENTPYETGQEIYKYLVGLKLPYKKQPKPEKINEPNRPRP